MILDFRDNASYKYAADQDKYEAIEVDAFRRAIITNPGSCVIDIGANFGYFTLAAAQLASFGLANRVIALEPDQRPVAALRRSLGINGWTTFCDVRQLIVSDSVGTESLWVNERSSADNRTHAVSDATIRVRDTYKVSSTTVDAIVNELGLTAGTPFIVKMDIQGNELRALRGMEDLLERSKWIVFFEFAPYLIRSANLCVTDLYSFLGRLPIDESFKVGEGVLIPIPHREGLISELRRVEGDTNSRIGGAVGDFIITHKMTIDP